MCPLNRNTFFSKRLQIKRLLLFCNKLALIITTGTVRKHSMHEALSHGLQPGNEKQWKPHSLWGVLIDKTLLLPSVMHLKWIFYASCFKTSTTLNQIPSYSFSGLSNRLRLDCMDDQTGGTKKNPLGSHFFLSYFDGQEEQRDTRRARQQRCEDLNPCRLRFANLFHEHPSNQPLRRLQSNPRRRDARFNLFAVFAVDGLRSLHVFAPLCSLCKKKNNPSHQFFCSMHRRCCYAWIFYSITNTGHKHL